jgi:YggT family protein
MSEIIHALDVAIGALRSLFGVLVVIGAVLAILDWLVRSRRVNAFGPIARFTRAVVDSFVAPVEKRLVRAGGTPVNAPWWALLFLVVFGAVLIGVLGFVREQLVSIFYASSRGPSGVVRLLVGWVFAVLQIALIVRVITSWVGGSYSRLGRLSFKLTEWILAPLRRVLPTFSSVDVSPLVAWFALMLLQSVVLRAL